MSLNLLYFPALAVAFSVTAMIWPTPFADLKPAIVPLLSLIMFSMGLTLRGQDFARVAKRPKAVGLGAAAQFTVMPLAAFVIGKLLGLEETLLTGLVLVGCCPGGTASNVIAYLAKADVALSITLTAVSTMVSVVATPLLVWGLLGQSIEVQVAEMLKTLAMIVLLPVCAGTFLNVYFHHRVRRLHSILPTVSMLAIVAVIGIVVGLNREGILASGLIVFVAVVLHNLIGLAGGYSIARLAGCDEQSCRTIGIEVGMQNSGLGVALATLYFSAAAALPGALFSIWHNLSGSLLASVWQQRRPRRDGESIDQGEVTDQAVR